MAIVSGARGFPFGQAILIIVHPGRATLAAPNRRNAESRVIPISQIQHEDAAVAATETIDTVTVNVHTDVDTDVLADVLDRATGSQLHARPQSPDKSTPDTMDASDEDRPAVLCRNWAIVPGALRELTAQLTPAARVDPSAIISAGDQHHDGTGVGEDAARVAMFQRRSAGTRAATQAGGEIAILPLRGTIRPRGSFLSMLFGGGGGLQSFREAFREAVADTNVEAIVIDIDSPGGLIDLVPEASAEIRAARGTKKIVAVANTLAASAAYWIAAQADELVVTPSGMVGSIGVFTIHEDFSKMEQMMGISTTLISAGEYKTEGSPYGPLSKGAQAALQDQVDQLYAMFTGAVAEGRGVKQEAVAAGYGSGRIVLAGDALQIGMVDRVETLEDTLARLGSTQDDGEGDDSAPALDDEGDDDLDLAATVPSTADSSGPTTVPHGYLYGEARREQPPWRI